MNEQGSEFNQATIWTVLKKYIKGSFSDCMGRWQGKPTMLIRGIEEGRISPATVSASQETVWLPSVPRWEHWCRDIVSLDPKPVDFFFYQNNRLEHRSIEIKEISELVQFEYYEYFQCDIKEIHGIAASKSDGIPYNTIKEFSERGCSRFLSDGFDENINWQEIRLNDMQFQYKEWANKNYYWINSGGSHHFAAAWKNAHDEERGRNFTLSGQLSKMTVNKLSLFSLSHKWDMYIMDRTTTYCEFLDAMDDFKCSFGVCPIPRGIFSSCSIPRFNDHFERHETEGKLVVILLLKGGDKQTTVSSILKNKKFMDFKPYLMSIVKNEQH